MAYGISTPGSRYSRYRSPEITRPQITLGVFVDQWVEAHPGETPVPGELAAEFLDRHRPGRSSARIVDGATAAVESFLRSADDMLADS